MAFWIRHIILIVLCVVLPLGAALYFDTESEKDRARQVGASTVRAATRGLDSALSLQAHEAVAHAVSVAQRLSDNEVLSEMARSGSRGEEAFTRTVAMLDEAAEGGRFAWLVDAEGNIVARNGATARDETPESVVGHPIFVATQTGNALDGIWDDRNGVVSVAGAPIVDDGAASGALLVGQQVGSKTVKELADKIEAQVTLIAGENILASSLESAKAQEVALPAKIDETSYGGRRNAPLPQFNLPMLPLLIDHRADGIAFASTAVPVRGSVPAVHWVVSVDSSSGLEGLAQRQEIIFGVLAASILLALLIGLVNHRTFVRPIDRVAEHLSEIQLGRGDLELPEARVSRPFRRLVRLINMTVQRMPARGLSGIGTADVSLSEARPVSRTGSLMVHHTPVPEPAPEPPPPAPTPEGLSELELPEPELPPPQPPAAEMPSPAPQFADLGTPQPAEVPADIEPSLPPPPGTGLGGDDDVDEAAAIAEAIASLEAGQALSAPPQPAAPSPRQASQIRGRPMGLEVPSAEEEMPAPFAPSQSTFLREGMSLSLPSQDDPAPPERPAPGVRGGGSLDLSGYAGVQDRDSADVDGESFGPEATVVAPVAEDLLAKSARDDLTDHHHVINGDEKPDMTVVASVPADLLAQSAGEAPIPDPPPPPSNENGLDAADRAHFEEVYERFIDMRRRCGEKTADLAFDRFLKKLTKNRENLIKKYHCRTVRFQVYEKDGKAALKATPVRAR
ncbi:MAG: MXAN_5187 C-terminal domain-containing protein [Deltaproteobacteria bacterium]|jgi:hypothetical protein